MSRKDDDLIQDVIDRLKGELGFKLREADKKLIEGKCPGCGKRETYAFAEAPWVIHCPRGNHCGKKFTARELFPELFDTWSTRFKQTEKEPYAAADAYLINARRLKIGPLKGAYTQELFRDPKRDITSATVRFVLPGGCYWERLIDQPGRFDKKANFSFGGKYKGHAWLYPGDNAKTLAEASEIWFAEGIFDAVALRQGGGLISASLMSCYNWPEHLLDAIRKACADLKRPLPKLVFALDIGKAGIEQTRKFVERAIEDGWDASAAQPRAEGETEKQDWNDLLIHGKLTPKDIETYLWHGQVLLAENASEKAMLLWQRKSLSNFSFVYKSKTYWASFNEAKIAEMVKSEQVSPEFAAERCAEVTEIANCAFNVLYFQQDKTTKEAHYFLSIDLADSDGTYRYQFSPAAMSASSEFKKALMGAAPGAQWTGGTRQLDRLIAGQVRGLKTVQTLDFTGYSREHAAWVLGSKAVMGGRVYNLNDQDYFDLGKFALKLKSPNHILSCRYDADKFDVSWMDPLWTAWRGNGFVTLTFWVMSFFAEQIRSEQASLGYLEMWGPANTGKSTIILFLWKLCGLVTENYEGIDPSKSTMVGYIRTLSRAANMPVVFVESDRAQDVPHSKKFDWSEIKGLFNGQIGRATGMKTGGNETYEPPFRGALLIEQNNQVVSEEPVLSRIMPTHWTKDGWSNATKEAAEAIEQVDRDRVSGTMIHIIRREATYMAEYRAAYARWEKVMLAEKVRHARVRKCHAQLHAGLDALSKIIAIPADRLTETHKHINAMAKIRDQSILADPKVVADFWEAYDFLEYRGHAPNVSKKPEEFIAINLQTFEQLCNTQRISCPPIDDLRKHLKMSRSRPYLKADTVNGTVEGLNRHMHCYIFRHPEATKKAA